MEIAERIAATSPQERKVISPTLNEHLRLPKQEMISTQGMMSLGAKQEAGTGKQEEKTVFDIKVIKEVRVFASLGLKEATELVEKVPVVIKQGLTKEEANGIIEKIKDVGGAAVME
ncbi:BnaC03g34520D [Brassica napus]|uniref:BnaC03g34520D protein n=1 Tax=Brassica napus TaxID=3708 RepID=A0A078IGE7_BRANA|nr:BnaC03g34520D [Brassica napus]